MIQGMTMAATTQGYQIHPIDTIINLRKDLLFILMPLTEDITMYLVHVLVVGMTVPVINMRMIVNRGVVRMEDIPKDMKMAGQMQDGTISLVLAMIHRAVLVTLIPIV
jgi:hypothetical protein